MTDTIAELRALLAACTKGDLSTAQRHIVCESVECPACQGDGEVEAADYCNFDGVALGVKFYGIGQEFGAHEKLWTAVARSLPALLDRVEAGEVVAAIIGNVRTKYAKAARNTDLSRNERTRCSHYLQVLDEISDALQQKADTP